MAKTSVHVRRFGLVAALALTGLTLIVSQATSGDTTYKYDDLGRVVQVDHPNGQRTTYSYDLADNRTATSTFAASTNSPPTCPSFTMTISPPITSPIQVQVPFGQGCSDPDGDTITTNPTPYTVTVYIHTSTPYSYTASDGHGGTTTATITVYRP
ncbi:MAG TPA: RHS repeat domain-containing protein [Asticcacaulis sp.]|nr:RHS repeat domain-containing protein [Asticcacaulis sp.]